MLLPNLRLHRIVVVTSHLLCEINHDPLAQCRDEALPGGLIVSRAGECINAWLADRCLGTRC